MQRVDLKWKRVAYALRTMMETEKRYAQIKNKALAATWACEKFSMYILGKRFLTETDHKPLAPLLGSKHLKSLPPRVLHFRIRLARFDYSIVHVPGKSLYTTNTLSRALSTSDLLDVGLQEEAEEMMDTYVTYLPATAKRREEYQREQAEDRICSLVINYCQKGWPEKDDIQPDLMPYWKARSDLTDNKNNLLLYRRRMVVPKRLLRETLEKVHTGHQGVQRCRLHANTAVWWPGLSHKVENMVKQCPICAKEHSPRKVPIISTKLPDYPWQKIGTDLFQFKGATYLVVVDYFSRFPEVQKLRITTSEGIIGALKSIFTCHGIPETVISDNGPQYASKEFADFAERYDFVHMTSSPHYAQSNGQAERTVQTVKGLLKVAKDPSMALLAYRSTPFPWCNLSIAKPLMDKRLRANILVASDQLSPNWKFLKDFRTSNSAFKD